MVDSQTPRGRRKQAGQYHHGDLRKALLQEAVRTIHKQGVERLTLRAVGSALGVSRTALYRHFSDKSALLGAVGAEGFRTLRLALLDAWESAGRGQRGFEAMSGVYVHFAVTHPSHYRVMFGGSIAADADPALRDEGAAAFHVLVDALIALQADGTIRNDDPLDLAYVVWSLVHGIAMLAIDGHLHQHATDMVALTRFAAQRISAGIGK